MMDNRSTVVGVFQNRDQVQCAQDALHSAGFSDDQIGIAMRNDQGTTAESHGTKAAEGAAGGVVAGGIIGGVLGAAASLLVPGVGPVLAGGILAATLAGAATGAVAGGLLGTLMGLGVPEEEAKYYDEEFRNGRIIMTTKAGNRFADAQRILRNCGAYDMQTQPGAEATADFTNATTDETGDQTMRLREEKLDIHKEPVQTGEVTIRKEVRTDTKTVDVPVSHEDVVIERKDLKDRPASGNVGEDKVIRLPVSEEEVRVTKTPVDTEEIRARKRTATENKQVKEDVKREEVRVERKGDTDVRGGKDLPDNPDASRGA